ncbi:MAG: hypothetical protein ACJ8GN_19065 [Longimicrobiaceae bacterium]
MPSWEQVGELIREFGWAKGVFTIFFFVAHAWIYRLYTGRLADRQQEIDRIAADNREYRERFLALLDRQMGLIQPELQLAAGDGTKKKKKEH